jgi:hypothetical protein
MSTLPLSSCCSPVRRSTVSNKPELETIISIDSAWTRLRLDSCNRLDKPMMQFKGVRISWDMQAKCCSWAAEASKGFFGWPPRVSFVFCSVRVRSLTFLRATRHGGRLNGCSHDLLLSPLPRSESIEMGKMARVNQNENSNNDEGDGIGCGKRVLRVAAGVHTSTSRTLLLAQGQPVYGN